MRSTLLVQVSLMRRHVATTLIFSALLAAWFLWQRGCDRAQAAIEVDAGAILVRNQTAENWNNVTTRRGTRREN